MKESIYIISESTRHGQNTLDCHEHKGANREPRFTHAQLAAMKSVDNVRDKRERTTPGAWIERQVNDLMAFFDSLMTRSKSNCTTRGHRVAVLGTRSGSLKCADCGAAITSSLQIHGSSNNAKKSESVQSQCSGFWVDEAALDRKSINRKPKNSCWQ